MLAGVEQREVLGLAVDVDQVAAQLAQQRDADRAPVDAGDVAAFQAQLARQGQVLGIVEQLFALEDLQNGGPVGGRQAEGGFHQSLVGTAADHGGIRAPTHNRDQGV